MRKPPAYAKFWTWHVTVVAAVSGAVMASVALLHPLVAHAPEREHGQLPNPCTLISQQSADTVVPGATARQNQLVSPSELRERTRSDDRKELEFEEEDLLRRLEKRECEWPDIGDNGRHLEVSLVSYYRSADAAAAYVQRSMEEGSSPIDVGDQTTVQILDYDYDVQDSSWFVGRVLIRDGNVLVSMTVQDRHEAVEDPPSLAEVQQPTRELARELHREFDKRTAQ